MEYSGLISENCVIPEYNMNAKVKRKYYNSDRLFGLLNAPYPTRAIIMRKYINEWIYDIENELI